MSGEPDYSGPDGATRHALDETEAVRARHMAVINNREFPLHVLLGLIPAGTRRLITEASTYTAQDQCTFFHASRTVTNAIGALINIERGLLVEGYALTRHCLENVAQAIVFLREAQSAEAWLQGKKFTPGTIRAKLGGTPDLKPVYDALSALAHANPDARWMHSLYVPPVGVAVWYGGMYQPKSVAEALVLLGRVIQLYIEEFFRHHRDRLDLVAWPLLMKIAANALGDLQTWLDSLPDDRDELAQHAAEHPVQPMRQPDITPEQMADFRTQVKRAFGYGGPIGPMEQESDQGDMESTQTESKGDEA